MNAATLTKPNDVLFYFGQLCFNGYSKTAFDLKIACDICDYAAI